MTRKTVNALIAQSIATYPDNNTGEITPSDIRLMWQDMLDTFCPMYGGLHLTGRAVNLTVTPQPLIFDSSIASFPPEWTTDPATGVISRGLGAVPGLTSKFFINGIVEGPQGSEVNFVLQKNGVDTQWRTEATLGGPSKSVGFAVTCIDYGTVAAAYRLMVALQSGSQSVTFRDVLFVGENIPIRDVAPGRLS